MKVSRIAAASLCLLSMPGAAGALDLPPPASSDWQPVTFRSIERTTAYTPLAGAQPGARAEARCSASALVLPLDAIQLAQTPVLRWRWRVLQPLDVADERSRAGDDFAARVYVMFRFEPERAGWLERVRRVLGERLYGSALPGTALTFVWASHLAAGSGWTSPHTEQSWMIALESGASREWRSEAVDLPATYLQAFGRSPPAATGIGIMTDADDTCQHAVAEYEDFRLTAREPDGTAGHRPAKPTSQSGRTLNSEAPVGTEER